MKAAFVGMLIIGSACLWSACNQRQETPQQLPVRAEGVNESCDFAQFTPLKGDFNSHPNPNDHIATPAYSDEARRAGIEGVVTLKVLVNGSGAVERVCVQSGDPKLVKTSVEAAQRSKFVPILVNQKAVPYVEGTLRFNYVLAAERAATVR